MAYFRNWQEFEEAVFGCHSNSDLFERFGGKRADFARDLESIIRSSKEIYPPTAIGETIHRQTAKWLEQLPMGSEGLVFLSLIDTKADLLYGADGLLFVPALHPHVATVDLFNIRSTVLLNLKETWIDSFSGEVYSEADFQSDLYLFKMGAAEWRKANPKLSIEITIEFYSRLYDFRRFADRGRPENHFILTPYHVGTYRRRREFSRMVAGYFGKVAKIPDHRNMALFSP